MTEAVEGVSGRAASRAFAAASALLVASAPLVRPAADWLRAKDGLRATTVAIGAAAAIAALAAVLRAARARRLRRPLLLVAVFTLYAIAFSSAAYPEERVHLVEYAILGLLALRAAGSSERSPFERAVAAFLLAFLVGWIDEAVQGLLPNRVYDPRDVALNALGAALAIAAQEFSMPVASSAGGAARRRGGVSS